MTPGWVLLPGTLCTGAVFDPLMDSLGVPPSRRRVVLADAPHVADYAPRLRAAVAPGDIVCGFSLGALVAAHNLAALSRAKALVLLAANPNPDRPGGRAAREALRDRIRSGGAQDWVRERWAEMSTGGPDQMARVVQMAVETTALIDAQTELGASRPGAVADLRASPLPQIYITGAEDRMTPASRLEGLIAGRDRAWFALLPGRGHFALLEDPTAVADAIRRGLAATQATHLPERQNHDA
ncbi:MAG: alpha/beta hydrolase [Pseudomonadota bacterium]